MNTRLKNLREFKKLSIQNLSKKINISSEKIKDWEEGIKEPSIEDLIVLSDFYEISVDYIVKGKSILEKSVPYDNNKKQLKKYFDVNNDTNGYIYGKYNNKLVSNKKNEKIGNTLILGCVGTGKARSIIKPNILQSIKNENSVIIIDTMSEFYCQYAKNFKDKGYKVVVLNLSNIENVLEMSAGINILSEFLKGNKVDEKLFKKYINRLYKILMLHKPNYNDKESQLFEILMYEAIKNDSNLSDTIDNLKNLLDSNEIGSYIKQIDYNDIFKDCKDEYLYYLSKNLYDKLNNEIINKIKPILSMNEFSLSDIYDKKIVFFINQNWYKEGICNEFAGFLIDILADKIVDNYIIRNLDIYFDEFFRISYYMKNLNTWFKVLKKKYIDKIRISVFYQNIEQIEHSTLNNFDEQISLIEFFNLFDTVISLGISTIKTITFIRDYMGFDKSMNMSYFEIQKIKFKQMIICRNNKTFIIEKNIMESQENNCSKFIEYRKEFLEKANNFKEDNNE